MATVLTDKIVRAIKPPQPPKRWAIVWDEQVRGFGARITLNGAVAFLLIYRNADGRQREFAIGRFGSKAGQFTVEQARTKAESLLRQIEGGSDPAGDRKEQREEQQKERKQPTFAEVLDDYLDSADFKNKRTTTQYDYRKYAERFLRPAWGKRRIAAIERRDVEAVFGKIKAETPTQANRVLAVASIVFNFAIAQKHGDITVNPASGVERETEKQHKRFLNDRDDTEIERFVVALDADHDQNACDALRLCLYTGSRIGEVLAATWDEINLLRGYWRKPSAHTKQKREEDLKVNSQAIQLLTQMHTPGATGPLFPGRFGEGNRKGVRRVFERVCKRAGLVAVVEVEGKRNDPKTGKPKMLKLYKPTFRIHDIRHTFGSILASEGVPLKVIGALMGHTNPATTNRYTHVMPNAAHDATEHYGKKIIAFNRNRKGEVKNAATA